MDVKNRITHSMLLAVVSSFLFACSGGENSDSEAVYDNGDATPPTLSITSPATTANYVSNTQTVSIAGIATDDIGVTEVTWQNDRGGVGSVNGTINWRYDDLALSIGDNVITVTAVDSNKNSTESRITITYHATDNKKVSLAGASSGSQQ